jgi:membrane-associated protein
MPGTVGAVTMLAISDVLAHSSGIKGLLDPVHLLTQTGLEHAVLPAILVIVFIETGLLFPILPGDSLLFTGGMLSAYDHPPVSIGLLLPAVAITAIAGDQCAYWIGRAIGPALFHREDGRFFKQRYVTETHAFFEKYGPKTIILGRFVPIVRTFMPVLAGVSKMDYRKFLTFDIVGGIAWGCGVTILGYFLGNVSFIRNHIESIFILIVLVSILPGIISVAKKLRNHEPVLAETAPAPSNEPMR